MADLNEQQASIQSNDEPQDTTSGADDYDAQNSLDQHYGQGEAHHDLNRSPESYDQEAQHIANHVLDTLEDEAKQRTRDTGGMVGGLPGTVVTPGNEANEEQMGQHE